MIIANASLQLKSDSFDVDALEMGIAGAGVADGGRSERVRGAAFEDKMRRSALTFMIRMRRRSESQTSMLTASTTAEHFVR